MNDKMLKQLTLLIFLNMQACTSIAGGAYSCPEKISASSTVAHVPDGWGAQGSNDKHHFLTSSTISDGHPSKLGFLRPSKVIKGVASETEVNIAVYDLSSMSNEGAWLVCRYGNTPAILTKRIEKSYRTCEISLLKDSSEQKIICKN